MDIPEGHVRASHVLIKHANSRNPVSRRTDESVAGVREEVAEAELRGWIAELKKDPRPMPEKFAALACHRSDCGSFQCGVWWLPKQPWQQTLAACHRSAVVFDLAPPPSAG